MIRGFFFAPANPADLLAKFPHFAANRNMIDLEDAASPAGKATLAPEQNN